MSEWTIVIVITSLVGLFGSLYKLFFQPIQALDLTLTVLNETIKNMSVSDQARDVRLGEHRTELIRHRDVLSEHDKRLEINERNIDEIKNTKYMKERLD